MRVTKKYLAAAVIAAATIALVGCAPTAAAPGGTDEAEAAPVKIAMLTSQTGPLAAYGEAYTAGFEDLPELSQRLANLRDIARRLAVSGGQGTG